MRGLAEHTVATLSDALSGILIFLAFICVAPFLTGAF